MPSRFGNTPFPDLDRLKSQLLTSGLQNRDQPLWQVIDQLIAFAKLLQQELEGRINSTSGAISNATFLTVNNESATFPGSRQLLAGTGISFDDSVPFQRTINASGASGSGYWTPLTDGDVDETDLIFANGEAIAVFVPTP